jgi:hypothetical protein
MGRRTTFTIMALILHRLAIAQCGTCSPDITCVSDPPFPTVCPAQAPDAVAGEPYDQQLTFWIPPMFTDPNTGFQVTVQEVRVTSVSGVPLGLDYQTDSPDQVYFPQVAPHGCVRVCGIPVVPGSYTASVSVDADVVLGGITLTVPQSLGFFLEVLPGIGGNSGFSFTPTFGCAPLSVDLQALVIGSGSNVTHEWTLGNGSSDTGTVVQTNYPLPGHYPIDLTTTVRSLRVNALTVQDVNEDWCGGIEEPVFLGQCLGAPDLYFTLSTAGSTVFTSDVAIDELTHTWNGLEVVLSAPPYTLNIIDQDPLLDGNDTLGTYLLTDLAPGIIPFSGNGTSGSMDLSWTTLQVLLYSDTVHVHPPPDVIIGTNGTNDSLCIEVFDALSVTWTLDGELVEDQGPCVAAAPGSWSVTVIDPYGCSGTASIILPEVSVPTISGGAPRLTITPQPASDRVIVELIDGSLSERNILTLHDAQGRAIHSQGLDPTSRGQRVEVDLVSIPNGVYVLRVVDGDRSIQGRVVVQH